MEGFQKPDKSQSMAETFNWGLELISPPNSPQVAKRTFYKGQQVWRVEEFLKEAVPSNPEKHDEGK